MRSKCLEIRDSGTFCAAHDLYIVICAARLRDPFRVHRWVEFIPERDRERCDRRNTVQDICDGQFEGVSQVLVTGSDVPDVTEDIARDCLAYMRDAAIEIGPGLLTFLENVLGIEAIRDELAGMEQGG